MKTMKRIHAVTIKRMCDESPDTSWLGEYASRPTSEYSIDRMHSLDCWTQTYNVQVTGIRILNHALEHLNRIECNDALAEACDIIVDLLDTMDECNCEETGDMGRNEYRYFNPSFNYVTENGSARPENTAEEIRKYVQQDYERMESLNCGNWGFVGVRAEAEISVSADTLQEVTSGGLWGIESDSNKDYFAEVEQEELAGLREQLTALGFSKRAIATAFKNVERD